MAAIRSRHDLASLVLFLVSYCLTGMTNDQLRQARGNLYRRRTALGKGNSSIQSQDQNAEKKNKPRYNQHAIPHPTTVRAQTECRSPPPGPIIILARDPCRPMSGFGRPTPLATARWRSSGRLPNQQPHAPALVQLLALATPTVCGATRTRCVHRLSEYCV